MSPREIQEQFLTEIIDIYRAIHTRCQEISDFLGAESIDYFDKEIGRLRQVVLDLSGATAKRKEYHNRLIELGAANVDWSCLERVNWMIYTDELSPIDLARWLLDYAEGKIFGMIDNLDEYDPKQCPPGYVPPTNAQMVKEKGLLPPYKDDTYNRA